MWEEVLKVLYSFSLEVFVAGLMFCFYLKKRRFFWVRLIVLGVLFIALTYDLPYLRIFNYIPVRFLLTFACSVLVLCLCFKPVRAVLFCSAAGFMVRVFAENLFRLLCYFSLNSHEDPLYDYVYYLVYVVVYVAAFFIFARRLARKETSTVMDDWRILPLVFIVIVVNELLGIWLYAFKLPNNPIVTIYGMLCGLLMLLLQFQFFRENRINAENEEYRRMVKKEKEQYDVSKENIALLNMKCHDIKHMLALLKQSNNSQAVSEYCRQLESTVSDYDDMPNTGSIALDVTIAEIRGSFRTQGISFTYSADGKLLEKLESTDIYSLFGNILRNALNGSLKEEEDKRACNLLVREKAGNLYIHEDNYCSVPVRFERGMPQTNGDNSVHGFGSKSIAYTVKKYGGNVLFSQHDNRFCVDILIPL